MDGFDKNKYDIIKLDDVQSELQIEEIKHKYGNRLVAYRYMVEKGKAEFLIAKDHDQ